MTRTKKSVVDTTLENTVNVKTEMGKDAIILDFTQDKPIGLVIAEAKQKNGLELNNNDKYWLKLNKKNLFTKVVDYVKDLFKK